VRAPKETVIGRQRGQSLAQMIAELPRQCDRGSKCNAQGYKIAWNGYKLHLDTADCGVPISVLLSSASMHDSRAGVPLSLMSAARVTNLYDLMDAAYCSAEQREHSRTLGHVPLIELDLQPARRGEDRVRSGPGAALQRTHSGRAHQRPAQGRVRWQRHLGQGTHQGHGALDVWRPGAQCRSTDAIATMNSSDDQTEKTKHTRMQGGARLASEKNMA